MDSVCSKTRSGDTIVLEVHSFFAILESLFAIFLEEPVCAKEFWDCILMFCIKIQLLDSILCCAGRFVPNFIYKVCVRTCYNNTLKGFYCELLSFLRMRASLMSFGSGRVSCALKLWESCFSFVE